MKVFTALALLFTSAAFAQAQATPAAQLRTQTTVVLVPTLVRNDKGEPVYTLKADDFTLTDDGIPQTLTLEQESGGEPLALVVVIEIGAAGSRQFSKYSSIAPPLAPMLESIVGNVPHRVAVVTFDSQPTLLQNFTPDIDTAAAAISGLKLGCTRQHHMENCAAKHSVHDIPLGDNGAAILDALGYSVGMLRGQPQRYRRAILTISETLDRGSHLTLDRALRAVTDTNTIIYSIAFSTGESEAAHYAARELPMQLADVAPGGGIGLENSHPNPPHGCMGKDPNPDPDATTNKAVQVYDCLTQLLPPLALAKMAAIEATDGLKQNIPETVARLTGGEYYKLTDAKSLERDLADISNHVPNRYMLSFHPQSPHPGFHSIQLRLKDYPDLSVTARSSYWAVSEDATAAQH